VHQGASARPLLPAAAGSNFLPLLGCSSRTAGCPAAPPPCPSPTAPPCSSSPPAPLPTPWLQLGYRLSHVMRRLLPVAMYLLQRDGQCLNGHDLFLKRVGACYHAFIDEVEKACKVGARGGGGLVLSHLH